MSAIAIYRQLTVLPAKRPVLPSDVRILPGLRVQRSCNPKAPGPGQEKTIISRVFPMTKSQRVANSPVVIFAAAACTRLAASIYILTKSYSPQRLFIGNEPSHIAAALVSGSGFASPYAHTPIMLTAQQPPLYPLFLAGIFKVFGIYTAHSAWTIVAFHILAGSFTAVVIYRLGRLYFGQTAAMLGGWLWVFPWMFQVRTLIVSLTNSYFAALGFGVLLIWLLKAPRENRGWFAIGVYAGLLLLLQTSFLPVLLVYAICLARSKARSAQMWFAVAGLFIVLAPWILRNYVVLHRFVPIRDNFGLELWLGNRPEMHGTLDYSRDFPGNDPARYIRLGETQFMDTKLTEALEYIMNYPKGFLVRCLHRVVEFWYVPYSLPFILFPSLAWVGAALVWKKHLSWLFITPLAMYPFVYYVTHMFADYRYPIEPVIMLLAAHAIVDLSSRAFNRCFASRAPIPSPFSDADGEVNS